MTATGVGKIGAVAIARNEGERLKNCLRSLAGKCSLLVYVDSGSTDGSVDFARSLGVEVVELDLSKPFSMARARNAGLARLQELRSDLELVQFVDGDCEVVDGWLEQAAAWLESHPGTVAVCGRRRERYPERSVFNRLCDIEWNSAIGPARSCGGDVLMRVAAAAAVGGYRDELIAGEEPELCLRLRGAGGAIDRIDAEMTRHDANILKFGQWWKRTVRGGYGALDVVTRLRGAVPDADVPFIHLTTSAVSWTDRWIAMAVLLTIAGAWWFGGWGVAGGVFIALGLQAVQGARIAWGVRKRAGNMANALLYGFFTMAGKWAQRIGQRRYRRDVAAGRVIKIIEYK